MKKSYNKWPKMHCRNNPVLIITDSAKQQFKNQLKNNQDAIGIKLGVKKTGCSGFSYTIDYAIEHSYNDIVIKIDEYNFYIDSGFLPYLEGITIDYIKKGLNEVFEFTNPNEKAKCGCGESFMI